LGIAVTLLLGCLLPVLAQGPAYSAFDPAYRAKARGVRAVSEAEAQSLKLPTALVRLANGKLALEARDSSGRLQPLYVIGLGGTGYWRAKPPTAAELAVTFANYRKLGANTCLYGMHWRDIEPQEGKFDFAYNDMVVETARKQGLKIWWVLFMHFQPDTWPEPGLDKFWVYNLDSRDGSDYAVQWLRDDKGTVYSSMSALLKNQTEVFPAYGHAKVFPAVVRMVRTLGQHYRNSDTVVGLQLGNEEGFTTAPWRNQEVTKNWLTDVNPVTQALFEDWKRKTGKSDFYAFKLDIVKYWWSRFAAAYHEGDPYKLVSFNLMTGGPEAGYEWWVQQTGVDSTTYGEGNIDVIAPMFHRPIGAQIWANLDAHYNFLYQPPILIPSEIGNARSLEMSQQYIINTLERGAQGYAVWSYSPGMVAAEGRSQSASGVHFQKLAAMVEANHDVLHPGIPGPGDVALEAAGDARVSQLHSPSATLGILHFPKIYDTKLGPLDWDQARAYSLWAASQVKQASVPLDVSVKVVALKAGNFSIQVFRDGKPEAPKVEALKADQTTVLVVPGMTKTEAVFLKVKFVPK
jgi:hypothetical protein